MRRLLLIMFVLGTFFSCKNKEQQTGKPIITNNLNIEKQIVEPIQNYYNIEELHWLIGNWTNISKEQQSYENWSKLNDTTLFSHSFTLIEKDTVFAEHLTLQQNNKNIFLTVVAYNQKDNKPVEFKLIPSEKGVFTFENQTHDFPSKISYSNPQKDSIHAWIEGTLNGEFRKMDFSFKRD